MKLRTGFGLMCFTNIIFVKYYCVAVVSVHVCLVQRCAFKIIYLQLSIVIALYSRVIELQTSQLMQIN